jgi:5-methylcytosine-specific restriction protein A
MELEIQAFHVSNRYSNEEIYRSLRVGNTGGMRANLTSDGKVQRIALFTSFPTQRQIVENPYHDRLEGNVLIYTGAGKAGDQTVTGANARLLQQIDYGFPIYAFMQIASRRDTSVGVRRWEFLGLLQYMRCYRERQADSEGKWRNAWVFEFRVHSIPSVVHAAQDRIIMANILADSSNENSVEDREVIGDATSDDEGTETDLITLEPIRRRLLACNPRQFEILIHDLLLQSGFSRVEVTKYSQDGGIDVNARPGDRSWPLRHLLIQIQAKRWLHTVGRKEIAELRGSLQPHAAGCVVTTSHFSRAALVESVEFGKVPITVIDGYELANIVKSLDLTLTP